MTYAIDAQLALAILNYLAARPYSEVWQMVQELQKLQQTPASPPLEPEIEAYS